MANILTAQEAAIVLRCAADDPAMLAMLPAIDAFIERATGRDWTADSPVCQEAKNVAQMLLVQWHEDPGMTGGESQVLGFGLAACITQLKVQGMRYIEFFGRYAAGAVRLAGAYRGDSIDTLVGLIGATGDQSALFEDVISVTGQIQQVSDTDLSEILFRVHLTLPSEL